MTYSGPRRLPRAEAGCARGFGARCACLAGAPVAAGTAAGGRAPARSRSPAARAAPGAPSTPEPPRHRRAPLAPRIRKFPAYRGSRGTDLQHPWPLGRACYVARDARAPGGARRGRRAPPRPRRRVPSQSGAARTWTGRGGTLLCLAAPCPMDDPRRGRGVDAAPGAASRGRGWKPDVARAVGAARRRQRQGTRRPGQWPRQGPWQRAQQSPTSRHFDAA